MALCCVTPVFSLGLSAHSAILMDGDTGQVLYEKNPDEISLIASTTKIMTALVTLEQSGLQDVVVIPREAVGIEGSSMYLKEGEERSVEDLLHGLMLSSGNDAAVALAIAVSGDVTDFVGLMNEKAQSLGLTHTHFANPNGLDSAENYATARDLATLTAEALKNDDFRRIVSTKSYHCEGHDLTNHNKLLWQYTGALGVKTGFTKRSGRCLVSAAMKDGKLAVAVTLNDPDDWNDHANLLNYGLDAIKQTNYSPKISCYNIPVIGSSEEQIEVFIEPYTVNTLETKELSCEVNLPKFLYAPVSKGDILGTVEYKMGDEVIGTVQLTALRDIPALPEKISFYDKIKQNIRYILKCI